MNEEMHEHEILVAIVVRTDVEREAAYLWLREALDEIKESDAGDWTHIDSFWIAEDNRPDKIPQQGLRSAVFVPEPLTQTQASSALDYYVSEHKS